MAPVTEHRQKFYLDSRRDLEPASAPAFALRVEMKRHKPVPDQTLLESIQNLAEEERNLRAAVLQLLHEVEERRLYAQLGHRSLFRFCQKELGLNEDDSYQLVMGMRLRAPELKPLAIPLSASGGGARKPRPRQP